MILLWSSCLLSISLHRSLISPHKSSIKTPAVNAGGGGGVNEDDEVVHIDNPAGVLSSEDHPSGRLN